MNCSEAREAISALLDGEASGVDRGALSSHLEVCGDCRSWQEAAHRITRSARLSGRAAPHPPPALYEALRRERSGRVRLRRGPTPLTWTRGALGLLALGQLILSVPLLVFGDDRSAPIHVAHEMGSLDVAIGIGFLAAVRRPARAMGMLALVGGAAALLLTTAVLDLSSGHTVPLDEAPHLVVVVGWLLLRRMAVLAPPSDARPRPLRAWALAARGAVVRRLPSASPLPGASAVPHEETASARAGERRAVG